MYLVLRVEWFTFVVNIKPFLSMNITRGMKVAQELENLIALFQMTPLKDKLSKILEHILKKLKLTSIREENIKIQMLTSSSHPPIFAHRNIYQGHRKSLVTPCILHK